MSIELAVLGYLSWKPHTGYDLKKLFSDSPLFYWSGNSNQIYRTLVKLHQQELVSLEVEQHENRPPRRTYQITEKGKATLREWVTATPEGMQIRRAFLVQLAWADALSPAELSALLDDYEQEVQMQGLMLQEKVRRGLPQPARTPREKQLWALLAEGQKCHYEAELSWIGEVRQVLGAAVSKQS